MKHSRTFALLLSVLCVGCSLTKPPVPTEENIDVSLLPVLENKINPWAEGLLPFIHVNRAEVEAIDKYEDITIEDRISSEGTWDDSKYTSTGRNYSTYLTYDFDEASNMILSVMDDETLYAPGLVCLPNSNKSPYFFGQYEGDKYTLTKDGNNYIGCNMTGRIACKVVLDNGKKYYVTITADTFSTMQSLGLQTGTYTDNFGYIANDNDGFLTNSEVYYTSSEYLYGLINEGTAVNYAFSSGYSFRYMTTDSDNPYITPLESNKNMHENGLDWMNVIVKIQYERRVEDGLMVVQEPISEEDGLKVSSVVMEEYLKTLTAMNYQKNSEMMRTH